MSRYGESYRKEQRIYRSVSRISISRVRHMSNELLEKTYQTASTERKSTLSSTLRPRKTLIKPEITPLFASKVIKKYIIPILKEKIKNDNDKTRPLVKLKLIKTSKVKTIADMLKASLKQCTLKLKDLKAKLESTLEETSKLNKVLQDQKEKINDFQITSSLTPLFSEYFPTLQKSPEKVINKLALKALEYKIGSNSQFSLKKSLKSKIEEEFSNNFQLKIFNYKQKYLNIEESVRNSITMNNLLSNYNSFSFMFNFLKYLSITCQKMKYLLKSKEELFSSFECRLVKSMSNIQEFSKQMFFKANLYLSGRKKAKALRNNLMSRITSTVNDLLLMEQDSQKIEENLMKKAKNFEDLKVEFEVFREKFNEKFGLDKTQFICKFCFETFKESENLNWSCHRHPGEWSGQIYWCCGKSKKEAPGCVKSKHVPDNEEEIIEKSEIEEICLSCKKTGHSFKTCPKDPNHSIRKGRSKSQTVLQVRPRKSLKRRPFDEIEKLKVNLTSNINSSKT